MRIDTNRINYLKVENGYNNADISNLTGISRPWLSTIFNRGYARPQTIHKLAKGLGVKVEDIVLQEKA